MNDTGLGEEELQVILSGLPLAPQPFDHLAHLRLAWICLRRHAMPTALAYASAAIHLRIAAHDIPGAYHATVTTALMQILDARGAGQMTWVRFLETQQDLVTDARAVLARHYTPDCLQSLEARRRFVAPDRESLPEPAPLSLQE